MNNENPYQPPATNLEPVRQQDQDVWSFIEPQKVSFGRGLSWLVDGARLFGRNPGIWILITIIYSLIMLFSSFVPFATNILQPMLAGGLMIGCHDQDNDRSLEVRHLFEGFNAAGGKLAILGALLLGISILVMIVVMILFFAGVFTGALMQKSGASETPIIIVGLLSIPIILGVLLVFFSVSWFGPSLIALQDLDVGTAFKMSLLAVKRNILPLLLFGFFSFLLLILGALTLYIGYLVIIPIIIASSYACWKDIFTRASNA